MKLTRRKIVGLGVLVLLLGGVCYLGVESGSYLKQGRVGAGFKAKNLCSGVFVSGRTPESVTAEDLSFHPLLDLSKTQIDFDRKEVEASVFGLIKSRAVFQEPFGAVLLCGSPGEKIRSRQAEIVSPEPQNPEEVPWPTGDFLSEEKPPGVDMLGLEEALDWAFSEPDPERLRRTRAVVVVYNGQIIAERYASGITKDTPLIGWSMTKSVINALVGILVGQGKIALQAPAPVPEWQDPDDPRHAITVDHLLRMSSGLRFIEEYEENPTSDVDIMLFTKPDTAAFAASFPLEAEPDTRWHYSSGTSNILSRIIRQCFPDDTAYWAFPRKALFNRIGMRTAVFETDASGTFVGASFLYASARDWARFGLLYLNEGVWEGERILPEGWVEYTTTPTPTNTRGSYGAHFWLNRGNRDNPEDRPFPRLPRDLFSCEGYQGQFVMILPSRNLVVVRLGMTTHGGWNMEEFMLKILDALPEPH